MNEHLEIKAALSVDEAGEITGIAWPFGSPDRVGDVIEKGAFAGTAGPLPMLFAHDQAQAVGVWDHVEETDRGLEVRGRLLIAEVERAREVRALIREGAIRGLSIGFSTKKSAARRGGGRTITALDLAEISVVAVPAHPRARITEAKAAGAAADQGNDMEDEAAPALTALETKMDQLADSVKGFGKLTDRLDRLEARLNRPGMTADMQAQNDNGLETKAFVQFARRGVERMGAEEIKSLVAANDAAGGYLAPEQFASELIKLLVEYSPIRAYARVMNITAGEVKFPRRTASTAATWVAETADRTASEPAFEQITLTPHELATFTDISTQLLEDNSYGLEGELMADFAESFGKTEGAAFVNGTGSGQPKGLMVASGITSVTTGAAGGFPTTNPADVLIGLYHSLPTAHAQRGIWLMNRNTLGTVRKWKDGDGRYLVLDPISQGAPSTLLGRPIVEAVDMDDIEADAFPILFGDLQGFRIVDRVALSVLRDPYSLATKGQVRFHARRRVGADVTHPDRFVKLQCAA
ncbi:phage major capsid protein [Propylenella binzhouense]|uniref:Phage major capsid protein n=1 Tax=Propylenella binzhouense TaxID=2555902 RepID=A0A964T2N0_9HYPH|nr:phage major capsid protein [Propylenella binzhouense]MYZ46467.1 phage major capsid protein [Propylenella binzhouense]